MLIGRMATTNVEELDIAGELEGLIAATSKISILGEMDTVEKSRELLTRINENLYKSLALSIPLRDCRNIVQVLEEQLARDQSTLKLLELEAYDLLLKRDMGQRSLECKHKKQSIESEIRRNSERLEIERSKLAGEYEKFAHLMLETAQSINHKVNELVILIRSELQLLTSEEKLIASSDSMQVAAERVIKQLFVELGARSDLTNKL